MGDVVNLRTARKQAKRRQADKEATSNKPRMAVRKPNAPSISPGATRLAKDSTSTGSKRETANEITGR